MSDMKATVEPTTKGFSVCGYEKIEYDFEFLDGVFNVANVQLAQCYKPWGRCLAVMDLNIFNLYGDEMQKYFDHHGITLKIHKTMIGEKAKSMETLLSIVDSMTEFGIYRKEPVLVVGGGLVTDVAGFACAAYRRNTNYIRIPTTVIGLIDASVSIKVAVNYGRYKNRLGAYHAPSHTFLDFTFLRTLPKAQIRNGFAELIKISTCAHHETYELLDGYCEELIDTAFGRSDDASEEIKTVADKICRAGIYEMLKLETPNLHEIMLDRVIAYGHTWSPLHELVPETPLRHGHAISIDMAYSATLAHSRGLLSSEEHKRLLNLFSRAGLSMDHPQFDGPLLENATAAILKTRDGKLRAAVPVSPMGDCVFLNDVSHEEMCGALETHKKLMKSFPRQGEGLEAYVDASDTGYTVQGTPVENGASKGLPMNSVENSYLHASGPEGVDGLQSSSDEETTNYTLNGRSNGYKDGVGKLSSGLKDKVNGLENHIFNTVAVDSLRGS
ncbi:DHQ-synthase domain-containing protein [Fusarium keratoplasticum]|uniref:DHQ-synthase domain-containing protein n=1 Tax=Fusarium keratoplasticum TaxID=1328300 RepID=A0ACC0QJB7_9HYPO|nr:DHQ-synthase domain-containing protein [Fusarium keratoplasticum]KAI8657197.1 DHQ-synthase domain-containing protein [Fusarium keratoplasticum]KAI8658173.1 DHQ-synthase domain-containing protein [Fusarium keratoplasticum]